MTNPEHNSITHCPICKDPLAWHHCTGKKNGCSLEKTRAKKRKDKAYPKRSERLTNRLLKILSTIPTQNAPIPGPHDSSRLKRIHVKGFPPPRPLDPQYWDELSRKCAGKSKHSRQMRWTVLEWLRYESLRLAKPRLTAEQKRERAVELEQIKTGAHHGLLRGEWPPPAYAVYEEQPAKVRRVSPVVCLRSKSFKIWNQEQTAYLLRTLIVPDIDDPNPVSPGNLLTSRLCVSLDINHSDDDLMASLAKHLTSARRAIGKTRGEGGGNLRDLGRMAEALRLYEHHPTNEPKKSMGAARTFGKYADNYQIGSRVAEAALEMISAAIAGPSVWRQTFR
jgi:hypothetical protein